MMQTGEKGGSQERRLQFKQKKLKEKLFAGIEEAFEPYKFKLDKLENRNLCGQEIKRIDEQFSHYRKDLQEIFTSGEILQLKNQLYKKADLRCEFRETGGHLPRKKFVELYNLEVETSSDKGRHFIDVCKKLGILEVSHSHENNEKNRQRTLNYFLDNIAYEKQQKNVSGKNSKQNYKNQRDEINHDQGVYR